MKNQTQNEFNPTEIKKAWKECLPGNLSNLFYYVDEHTKSIQRFKNAFYLGEDGITALLNLNPSDTNCIRIYMGSKDHQFTPIFSIVVNGQESSFELKYNKENKHNTQQPHFLPLIQVTRGVVDLFRKHWEELSDLELSDAFSGVTIQNIYNKNESGSLKTRRVTFYEFPSEDVNQMVENLQSVPEEERYVYLLLGAGLTVRLTHPFNFRPILTVPSLTPGIPLTNDNNEIVLPEAYFERSQPCPPYCPDGTGS